jgi:prefoldin subunit 5
VEKDEAISHLQDELNSKNENLQKLHQEIQDHKVKNEVLDKKLLKVSKINQ